VLDESQIAGQPSSIWSYLEEAIEYCSSSAFVRPRSAPMLRIQLLGARVRPQWRMDSDAPGVRRIVKVADDRMRIRLIKVSGLS